MNPCPMNSEFKILHNDVKEKLLVFQDQERFLEVWTTRAGGEKGTETSWLSCIVEFGHRR